MEVVQEPLVFLNDLSVQGDGLLKTCVLPLSLWQGPHVMFLGPRLVPLGLLGPLGPLGPLGGNLLTVDPGCFCLSGFSRP